MFSDITTQYRMYIYAVIAVAIREAYQLLLGTLQELEVLSVTRNTQFIVNNEGKKSNEMGGVGSTVL
jgi:hypothetical protein